MLLRTTLFYNHPVKAEVKAKAEAEAEAISYDVTVCLSVMQYDFSQLM